MWMHQYSAPRRHNHCAARASRNLTHTIIGKKYFSISTMSHIDRILRAPKWQQLARAVLYKQASTSLGDRECLQFK
jgi:hypothetical protein